MDKYGNKTGGRQKGTPNKRTKNLTELIEKYHKDFDPVLELIGIYKDQQTPKDLKVNILKDLAGYIYPKRKAVEADIKADLDYSYDGRTLEELVEEYTNNRL